MKKLFFILLLLISFSSAAEPLIDLDQINTSQPFPSISMDEDANITLDGGFVTGLSTDMYISPMTFGAVGDGVTDDTEALKDTIDFANDSGYRVFLPMMTFRTTEPLNLSSGVVIEGQRGSYSFQSATTNGSCILYDGSDCAINITDPDGGYIYIKLRCGILL